MKNLLSLLVFSLIVVAGFLIPYLSSESKASGSSPDPILFQSTCGQYPDVLVESNSVTITGIADPVPIAIISGEYSINGGPYTNESGTISFGQTVSVRHKTSSSGENATNSSILTVGGLTATFTSSTGPCLRGTQ